jgi:hypothetical protein
LGFLVSECTAGRQFSGYHRSTGRFDGIHKILLINTDKDLKVDYFGMTALPV